jgi:hypothetical protein
MRARNKYQRGMSTPEEIEKFDKINTIWNYNDWAWNQNFLEAEKCFRANGNLNMKSNYVFKARSESFIEKMRLRYAK